MATIQSKNFYDEISNYEKKLICEALAQTNGNQARAARMLCLRPTTLAAQIRRLGIDAKAFKQAGARRGNEPRENLQQEPSSARFEKLYNS